MPRLAIALLCAAVAPGLAGARQSATDIETFRTRADSAREANHLQEAAAIYKEAVRQHPKWIEGRWYLGTISYELGDYATCRSELEQVVAIQTKNGAAWGLKGLCEFQVARYDASLGDLTRASDLGVGEDVGFQAVVGFHRGLLLARAGQFERAFDVYDGFVRGGNRSPEVLEALGLAMLRLRLLPAEVPAGTRDMVRLAGTAGALGMSLNRAGADRAFLDLVTRYPDAPNVHYAYGTFLSSDRPEDAIAQFRRELEISPRHALAHVAIAQELIKRGDYVDAAPHAADAVRLAPKNFLARKVLGEVRLNSGDVPGAIAELEAARTLEPSSPSVRFHLARAYQRAGRTEDARREREAFSRLEAIQQKQRGAVTDAPAEP
jgi:tetratricopeptide (TPR) repeat protein